jgi:hypothetical protein
MRIRSVPTDARAFVSLFCGLTCSFSLGIALATAGCASDPPAADGAGGDGGVTADGSQTNAGRDAGALSDAGAFTDVVAPPLTVIGWATAPELTPVTVIPNRDSVVVSVPAVSGVQDYRVVVTHSDTTVTSSADGHEEVKNALIFCAGRSQHAAPVESAPNTVLQLIEVPGVTEPVRVVVEAIDRECPFPGWLGLTSVDLPVLEEVQAGTGSDPTFPIRTAAQMKAIYGSVIYNGQGPGAAIARPAERGSPPKVLARTELQLTPKGTGSAPMPFWEDFSNSSDQFAHVAALPGADGEHSDLLQNSRWNYYTYDLEPKLMPAQVMIDRGRVVTYAADPAQEILGVGMLTPRAQPVALADDAYAHVTFETTVNATDRRYVWFTLCGPGSGTAYDAAGALKANLQLAPFFYQPSGASPLVQNWNCLQVFGFDGSYYGAIGEDKADVSIRMVLNRAQEGQADRYHTVVDIAPRELDPGGTDHSPGCAWCAWYGVWNASHTVTSMPLDALLREAPAVRWDVYIRRDRVVLYFDGHQYACSDFPRTPLTMAEGAFGLGQVLYHSSAEHGEFTRRDWVRTGQRFYLTNGAWMDQRAWDNVGLKTGDALPADFREDLCFVSQRTVEDWTAN